MCPVVSETSKASEILKDSHRVSKCISENLVIVLGYDPAEVRCIQHKMAFAIRILVYFNPKIVEMIFGNGMLYTSFPPIITERTD